MVINVGYAIKTLVLSEILKKSTIFFKQNR